MERRMLLAIVLSFLAVTAYSALTGKGCMAPPPKKETPADGAEETASETPPGVARPGPKKNGDGQTPAASGDPKSDSAPRAEAAASDLESHPQRKVEARRITLTSPELTVVLTSQGGAISSVTLNNAYESDGKTPFDQIVPMSPIKLMGQIDDTGVPPATEIDAPGDAERRTMPPGPMRNPKLQWTHVTTNNADEVVFAFTTPEGLTYRKRWTLTNEEDRYDVHLDLSVSAAAGADAPASVQLKLLAVSGQLREHLQGAFTMPSGVIYRLSSEQDISDTLPFGLEMQTLELKGRSTAHLSLFGTKSPFFITLYYVDRDAEQRPAITHYWATGEHGGRGAIEDTLEKFYRSERDVDLLTDSAMNARVTAGVKEFNHCWLGLTLPVDGPVGGPAGASQKPARFSFYVGPIQRTTLAQDVYAPINSVVTYPNAPDFVADILLGIYDFWRSLFGSAGLAIILMTICVRGAMMPLSVRNQLSMRRYGRKVAKLKPKVKQLQTKYASNPKKLREEQMKLYREHGVGFPSGCLMMFVQIPIFFALFSSLRVEYTIRGASFLWIKDLSGPDKLIDFGSRVIDLGIFYVDSFNILPLIMVTLSILHTRNMPKPADEQQAQQMKMMKWLPIMFAVILYNYTAALAMYMVLSSAVAIIESKIVRSKDEADLKESEAAPA